MRCRVIKPGFVRRTVGARIKSVRVDPPAEIDWPEGEEVPLWLEPLEPAVAGDAPPVGEASEGDHTPPAGAEVTGSEGPPPASDDPPPEDEPKQRDPHERLAEISGIGPDKARMLVGMGIKSLKDFIAVGTADPDALIGMPGISAGNLPGKIEHARKLLLQ